MPLRNDLTGQVFGKLTVISISRISKNGHACWNCICSCGENLVVFATNLKKGNTTSCGCHHKSIVTGNGLSSAKSYYRHYEINAKRRNYAFEITFDQFYRLSQGNCTYCGIYPKQVHTAPECSNTFTYNGIDRRDNSIGYTIDNCYPCCGRCNRAKMNMSHEDFLEMCRMVSSNWGI